MVNKESITIRIPSDLKAIIYKLADEFKVSVTGLITLMVTNSITDPRVQAKLTKDIAHHLLSFKRRKFHNRMYIIKNMTFRVSDIAMSSFLTVGRINMKIINRIIEGYIAEFELFTDEEKNLLQVDFAETVRKLKTEEYYINHSKNFKMLKYIDTK